MNWLTSRWRVELTGVTPSGVPLLLRELRRTDERELLAVRRLNRAWLDPWEPTMPEGRKKGRPFADVLRAEQAAAKRGERVPLVIFSGGELVGQVNGSSIIRGAAQMMSVGYWVAREAAGQGIAPTAVALLCDYAFGVLALHRVEVNIRPENDRSLAVVRKLGLRDEGVRERFLHIDGAWRDHRSFAVTVDELDGLSMRERLDTLSHH